jgi:hypothetical protein
LCFMHLRHGCFKTSLKFLSSGFSNLLGSPVFRRCWSHFQVLISGIRLRRLGFKMDPAPFSMPGGHYNRSWDCNLCFAVSTSLRVPSQ